MFISSDSLKDLNTTFSGLFLRGLEAPITEHYKKIAQEISSSGPQNTYPVRSTLRGFREWKNGRQFQPVEAGGYFLANKLFEDGFSIPKVHIEDDNFGIYNSYSEELGKLAIAQREELVFELLSNAHNTMAPDGSNFFDTAHKIGTSTYSNSLGGTGHVWFLMDCSRPQKPFIFQNRLAPEFTSKLALTDDNVFYRDVFEWGARTRNNAGFGALPQLAVRSRQPLNEANYLIAKDALRGMVNDQGKNLGLRPTTLVVGLALEDVAFKLFGQDKIAGGESNYLRLQGLDIVVSKDVEDIA